MRWQDFGDRPPFETTRKAELIDRCDLEELLPTRHIQEASRTLGQALLHVCRALRRWAFPGSRFGLRQC